MYRLNEWGPVSVLALTQDGLLLSQPVVTDSGVSEVRVMTYPLESETTLEEAMELFKSYPKARIIRLKSAKEFTGSMLTDDDTYVGYKLNLSGVLSDEDTTINYVVGELDVPVEEDFTPVEFIAKTEYDKVHK